MNPILKCAGPEISIAPTYFKSGKYLLEMDRLEEIAVSLMEVAGGVVYPESPTRGELQQYCFTVLLGLCKEENWESVKKVQAVIQGLTDSEGRTILSIYVKDCLSKSSKKNCIPKGEEDKVQKIVNEGLASALSRGETPLHTAVKLELNFKGIKRALKRGYATPLDRDAKGRLPIHLAVKKGRSDLIAILSPALNKKKVLRIIYYSQKQHLDLCPYSQAVLRGDTRCLDVLKKIVDEDFVEMRVGFDQLNILHLAIAEHQYAILEHLLNVYFDETKFLLNARDRNGCTPLMYAAMNGNTRGLILLIKKGANIEARDFEGRTAVHHAAIKDQLKSLQVLASYDAKLKAKDLYGKAPYNLAKKITTRNFIQNIISVKPNKEDVNYILYPPENLVFKGGGPKGVAYLGALRALEKRELLGSIRRVAGTSAGAITAVLLCLGLGPEKIHELLESKSGTDFLDHPFTEQRINECMKDNANASTLLEIYNLGSEVAASGSPLPLVKKLSSVMWHCTGICSGSEFLNWIEGIIAAETGVEYCTLGELAELIEEGKPFKHLHAFANMLNETHDVVHFSSEDPEFRDYVISDIVRASISIPVVYKPHILVLKRKNEDGEYVFSTENGTYKSRSYASLREALRTAKDVAERAYIDGGVIQNFPIKAFDQRGYCRHGVTGKEKRYSEFNPRTLGFTLYSGKEERTQVHSIEPVQNVGQLVLGVYEIFRHAETLISRVDEDPRNKERIIALDTCGISLFGFNTNTVIGKGFDAAHFAEETTEHFFAKQEKKFQHLLKDEPAKVVALEPGLSAEPPPFSEAEAQQYLTLGPLALNSIKWTKRQVAADAALGVSIFPLILLVMPKMTVEGAVGSIYVSKSLSARKFEYLAWDQPIFTMFEYIGRGQYVPAKRLWEKNKTFFTKLMKTRTFILEFRKCLYNCDNLFYKLEPDENDPLRGQRYLDFFRYEIPVIPDIISERALLGLPTL